MVINIQAFAARGADNRRIYEELDDFQSRKPIDVIASNRPILILDEPQKMEGAATMEALPKFKPLMILRYSATHKTQHNRVHRLDALDAYNQKPDYYGRTKNMSQEMINFLGGIKTFQIDFRADIAAYAAGDVVRGTDAIRALRP